MQSTKCLLKRKGEDSAWRGGSHGRALARPSLNVRRKFSEASVKQRSVSAIIKRLGIFLGRHMRGFSEPNFRKLLVLSYFCNFRCTRADKRYGVACFCVASIYSHLAWILTIICRKLLCGVETRFDLCLFEIFWFSFWIYCIENRCTRAERAYYFLRFCIYSIWYDAASRRNAHNTAHAQQEYSDF